MVIDFAMTTADRSPRHNYLGATLAALRDQNIYPCVFPTSPDIDWLPANTPRVFRPVRHLNRVENGARLFCEMPVCDWVVHLEDDIAPCADLRGSVARWLTAHARDNRRIVLLWSAERYDVRGAVADHAADRLFGAVGVAMRYTDARDFGAWAWRTAPVWRSGSRRKRGFDKMMAAWHRVRYPNIRSVSATVPSLIQHLGRESSLDHLEPKTRWQDSPTFTGAAYV